MASVANLSFEERLRRVFQRTLPKLAPDTRAQLSALIEPKSLAIVAGVVVLWIGGHSIGVGEFVDIVIGLVGFFSIGLAVFSGLDELFAFARGTYEAKIDTDLDAAADHFAKAIVILGINVILALLFKARPRGGRVSVGPEPVRMPGIRFRPQTVGNPALRAGEGATSFWGDVEVSTAGTAEDQAIVLLHEKVHQFLAPKFYILRRVRVENRLGSYFNTSLYRFVEEALAETVGQIGVRGLKASFAGLRFPVSNGYVYLMKAGGTVSPMMKGAGLLPEGAGLLAAGTVQAFAFQIWFKPGVPGTAANTNQASPLGLAARAR